MKTLSKVLALAFYLTLGLMLVGFAWLAIAVDELWFYPALGVAVFIVLLAAEDHKDAMEAQVIEAADPNPAPAIGIARIPAQRTDDEIPAGEF